MKLYFFALLILFQGVEEPPYKPFDEFEFKLKYELKSRSVADNTSVYLVPDNDRDRKHQTALLPYIGINVTVLKVNAEEVRMKASAGKDVPRFNRKVRSGDTFFLEMGFTDDMKDGLTPGEYTVNFFDAKKKAVSRIVFKVAADGTFLVNDEKRGKL